MTKNVAATDRFTKACDINIVPAAMASACIGVSTAVTVEINDGAASPVVSSH